MMEVSLLVISKYSHSSDGFSLVSLQAPERGYAPNVLLAFIGFFPWGQSTFRVRAV